MAYTLAHQRDIQLLDELLKKVISRESAVHALMIIDKDGQIIRGLETYDNTSAPAGIAPRLLAHWPFQPGKVSELPDEFKIPMQGKRYIGVLDFHLEGVFFIISVPIGPLDQPLGALVAHVDAKVLWQALQQNLQRERVHSYLVNSHGQLLISPKGTGYSLGDRMIHLPVVKALVEGRTWNHGQVYKGLMEQQVFGSLSYDKSLQLGIITEVEREHILQPIRTLLFNLAVSILILVLFFLWLGMLLAKRIIKPIDSISSDFERVIEQDYTLSSISSPFSELHGMVDGFNHMVSEIGNKQLDLQLASAVFESTSEGIVITNAKHNIININKAYSDITGYSKEDVLGRNPSILKSGWQDEEFYQAMWQSIEKTDKWCGEVWNRRKNGDIYPQLLNINTFRDAHGKVAYRIGIFTEISSIKETEEELQYLAHHDPLTDLPNRLLCYARLQHQLQLAQRDGGQVAVLFLDLDMFKNVNDSLGHAHGDKLLQLVATRISSEMRSEDTIARLGGDEFLLILGSLKRRKDVVLLAEKTLSVFTSPFNIDEQEIFISASIGISLFPDDGKDTETLIRNADSAMYYAKSEGRNNYQFYTASLTTDAFARLNLETSLRHALEKDELFLCYQPQYSMDNNQMIGVEALLRWKHPEMGMVYPDKFIPVAEETGLIVSIGEWVLETACRQLKTWHDAGYPALKMAVNLSARQFWKPGLAKVIERILQETGINAEQLDLELTESIIMHDTEITINTLNELEQLGVEISIDDFGTGYSSLGYIKRFPITRLKIDRSFVSDVATNTSDAEMVASIIALGHAMKLKVLAEGVESEEQLRYLQEQGCDEVQGFFYSRPVTADEFEQFLFSKQDDVM
jgi:diguanylate cyclase (GGDEF)-like protein/PAS domain S-box-containing protein